jgi:hypothetical protein
MATEIVLSSTESEYAGASAALWEAILVMELLKEMKEMKVPIQDCKAKVHCKLYETTVVLCRYFYTKDTVPEPNIY